MTEEGAVITFPDGDFSGIKKRPELSVAEFVELSGMLKNQNTAINQYTDPITGWEIYNVYDTDLMLADVVRSQRVYILFGSAAILFAFLMIVLLVRQINRSVRVVVSGIKEVQAGNLDVVVPLEQSDEIGDIARNVNEMTVRIKKAVTDEQMAVEKQKNAEIRALEAQINPHFLYKYPGFN